MVRGRRSKLEEVPIGGTWDKSISVIEDDNGLWTMTIRKQWIRAYNKVMRQIRLNNKIPNNKIIYVKQQTFISHFGGWEVQDQGAGEAGF